MILNLVATAGPLLGLALHTRPIVHESTRIVFGQSVMGRNLEAFTVGTGSQTILVLGSIHGDEKAAGRIVRILLDDVRAGGPLSPDTRIVFIPAANPDGLERGTRVNQNNVDINRNFNAKWAPQSRAQRYSPGPSPESEPETRAYVNLIRDLKPIRIMSIHCPLRCVNWDGPAAEEWANRMSKLNGYPVKGDIGYPTPGSLGKFCIDRGIPLVTLELTKEEVPSLWTTNRGALRVFLGLEP